MVDKITDYGNSLGSSLDIPGTLGEEIIAGSRSKNVPKGGEPRNKEPAAQATWSGETDNTDWRVRLGLPSKIKDLIEAQEPDTTTNPGAPGGESGTRGRAQDYQSIMQPLIDTNGMIFPYTPSVYITYSANYDSLQPTHSNYPFPVYQNSAIDQFTIQGDFTVQNSAEGRYWIAANHFLRTVTKMEYGDRSQNTGAPPPVLKLNGYGDFVFKDVPVVVQSFNIELSSDIDYIEVPMGNNGSWAPTRSTISVTLKPSYSRASVNQFNFKKFAEGGYLNDGPGFI